MIDDRDTDWIGPGDFVLAVCFYDLLFYLCFLSLVL